MCVCVCVCFFTKCGSKILSFAILNLFDISIPFISPVIIILNLVSHQCFEDESRKLKVPIMSQYVAPSSLLLILPMGKTLTYDFKII